ncbi:MAG: universal stress protein [Bacteroidetes bacterium]|jgi:nucleotide-binding universal stress UspA family protein|nr:universal stress protein [Bacteroidota bacterium]
MKSILCPTDFSKNSAHAVAYAAEMALKFNARILLLHTFETPILYSDITFVTMQYDFKILHDAAAEKLRKFKEKMFVNKFNEIKVELVLQQGLPSARINEVAAEKKADLIVMGTTGTGAAERLLIGSNAARVIKSAPCPVFLIPPRAKFSGLGKMVYATDLTDENLDRVKTIIPLAKIFNSELLFLYVDKTTLAGEDVDIKKITALVRKKVKYPKQSGYVCTDTSIQEGINFFLKKYKADALVLFTRHRNIFKEVYKPSISKKLSFNTKIPLLVIHEQDAL